MSARLLHLAKNFNLPVDLVTQTIAIIAKRRAGKSYTMRRIAEQLFKAGQQIVLVDPKGDQWGIRSAADGKGPGLPIVIVGGERGDVPLEPSGGEVVAKLVVEERVSVLLDLSTFRKHEVATFMTAFLENLYRLKAREQYRTPMMLVIDEADAIAPQKPQKGEERMLGAAEDIVRRGGQRGIGCVLVTQRSAVLNKNVLTQAQMLVALRTIAPQDLAAMNAWIDVHGTVEQKQTLMESLPSLPVGDAWFWSPGWPTTDGIFERVHVLPIETFDSGATPKAGEKRVEPKRPADVDLEALKRQMAATIEKAKQDDPRELRRQIADLKKQLSSSPATKDRGTTKTIEKFVLKDGQLARAEKLLERIDQVAEKYAGFEEDLRVTAKEIRDAIVKTNQPLAGRREEPTSRAIPGAAPAPSRGTGKPRPARSSLVAQRNGDGPLSKMQRAMLTTLAQHADGLTKKQILVHTGYASSGPVSTAFADLAREGWVSGDGNRLRITDTGLKVLGPYDPLPLGDDLREWLLTGNKLNTMEKALLTEICKVYPDEISKGEILERAQYASSGPVSSAFAKLVAYNYAIPQGPSRLKAAEELFS